MVFAMRGGVRSWGSGKAPSKKKKTSSHNSKPNKLQKATDVFQNASVAFLLRW